MNPTIGNVTQAAFTCRLVCFPIANNELTLWGKSTWNCMTRSRREWQTRRTNKLLGLLLIQRPLEWIVRLVLNMPLANKFFVSCYDRGQRWFSNEAERFNQKFQRYKSSSCGGYSRIYPAIISPGVTSMLNNPIQNPNSSSFKRRATFRKE